MSSLKEKIQKEVTEAMKARNASRLQTLRLVWNSIRKKEIDERKDLTDAEVEKTLLTMIKQVQETLEQAKTSGRQEAVSEAENEILVMKEFLPQQLSEAEVLKIITDVYESMKSAGTLPQGGAAMGALMKQAMSSIGSKAEGKVVQTCVRKVLGLS